MRNFISKYKIYIILSIVAILILVFIQLSTKNQSGEALQSSAQPAGQAEQNSISISATPVSGNFVEPSYSKPPENIAGQVDMTSDKVITAIESKNKLKGSLPIYIESFKNSNGMLTTLNVYTIPSDPEYLVHVEIYGINFRNQDPSKETNPNVVAFIDSFEQIKKLLATKGVDIHNIYFIFGQRTFIQETADLWIRTYGLL